jgi:hypothetical protein
MRGTFGHGFSIGGQAPSGQFRRECRYAHALYFLELVESPPTVRAAFEMRIEVPHLFG